uniref:Uncharacterized protein n=1 Tax=Utricularia reniformis TaxID=192314 RepID=A0A1Y0B1E7_9LAMI|nr:hypothetical protein AEK19_MT0986 [Utricularia reniformis]ART31211.1 hypothetical protein AEK19_MT0986 [Utricularia reniformis]
MERKKLSVKKKNRIPLESISFSLSPIVRILLLSSQVKAVERSFLRRYVKGALL